MLRWDAGATMDTKSAVSGADSTLAHQLAVRFTAALLPAEAADFEAARIAEAAFDPLRDPKAPAAYRYLS